MLVTIAKRALAATLLLLLALPLALVLVMMSAPLHPLAVGLLAALPLGILGAPLLAALLDARSPGAQTDAADRLTLIALVSLGALCLIQLGLSLIADLRLHPLWASASPALVALLVPTGLARWGDRLRLRLLLASLLLPAGAATLPLVPRERTCLPLTAVLYRSASRSEMPFDSGFEGFAARASAAQVARYAACRGYGDPPPAPRLDPMPWLQPSWWQDSQRDGAQPVGPDAVYFPASGCLQVGGSWSVD